MKNEIIDPKYDLDVKFQQVVDDCIKTRYIRLMSVWNKMMIKEKKTNEIETYKDITEEERERRLEDYLENPKDQYIVYNIKDFIDEFENNKDENEVERGELIIEKGQELYEINYQVTSTTTGICRKFNFRAGDKESISGYLYMIDIGLVVWDQEGHLQMINNILLQDKFSIGNWGIVF